MIPSFDSTDPASPAAFYQTHLDRVSRSFAFCISRLDGVLRERVGLSYLLCRLLDTVEDAAWPGFVEQEEAFQRFDSFIRARPASEDVAAWRATFPPGLPDGEIQLLAVAERFFADFHDLPESERTELGLSILSMSGGMRYYMRKKMTTSEGLRLKDRADVNRYCFFVAGLVGEILTRFIARELQPSLQCLKDAFRFGLFLQKVNLLKDQRTDEAEGRFLVPSRRMVLESLLADGEAALRFLKSLPERETSFRLFCAWSLFLGLGSLPWIQRAELERAHVKIPRDEAVALFGAVESQIHDNEALGKLFHDLAARSSPGASIEVTPEPGNPSDEDEALLALYRGDLPASEVLRLFHT